MSHDKKIISINKELGRLSAREVLEEMLEKVDEYGALVVVAERRRDLVEKGGEPYDLQCSDMTVADANYLLDAGKFMLFHSEE